MVSNDQLVLTICTGAELITITIDENGDPVEEKTVERDVCSMSLAVFLAERTDAKWQKFARDFQDRSGLLDVLIVENQRLEVVSAPRGPPTSI